MNSIYDLLNDWELATVFSRALTERDSDAVRQACAVMRSRREQFDRIHAEHKSMMARLDACPADPWGYGA